MKKKAVVAALCLVACSIGWCGPHGHGGLGGPGRGPAPMHFGGHHGGWGHGGRGFWPGFAGGIVGGVIGNAVFGSRPAVVTVPAPQVIVTQPVVQPVQTVVTQPQQVIVQQPAQAVVQPASVAYMPASPYVPCPRNGSVWVPGHYVEQVQPNGTVLRIWQPGRYE
jgi:hypothetical protein